MVVIHHLLLANPQVADRVLPPAIGSLTWAIQSTPLKIFSAGAEAVLVFFVLSGMVLMLPLLRTPRFDWIKFYPQRVIRLYLPVVASVVLSAILILVHPQLVGAQVSEWVGAHSFKALSFTDFIRSLDLFERRNLLNNPLWTLRWELIFSLCLPLFFLCAVLWQRRWALCLGACTLVVWLGIATNTPALEFLPVFFGGCLLAMKSDDLKSWAQSMRGARFANLAWFSVLCVALSILLLHRMIGPLFPDLVWPRQLAFALSFLGAILVVAVSFLWEPAIRMLSMKPVRWLGRISFSLYLVHVPIIYFYANLFGPGKWPETAAAALVTSLLVAELFVRVVERPANRLAKLVGKRGSHQLRVNAPAALAAARAARQSRIGGTDT